MSRTMSIPIRILTAVPICDGHDSAINTINLELVRHGVEVIYLGYHRPARDVVRAAIQEDVRAVGISSYNGGHVEFFSEVVAGLRKAGADDVAVFGGGGGTIAPSDVKVMLRRGVDRIFGAGTPLAEVLRYVQERFAKPAKTGKPVGGSDREIAKLLTRAEAPKAGRPRLAPPTVGITGPGGAGKTTLIDELVYRFLRSHPTGRVAILSHDPSVVSTGALLGDRATMIHSQDDRVFMRSLATRGQAGGLAPETESCLRLLKSLPFDLVLVETVGTGQEAMPFRDSGLVDRSVFVTSPDYGSRLQLQKIAMLDLADVVVINKSDLAGGERAQAEVQARIESNHRGQRVVSTVAKRHRDGGVDGLFELLLGTTGVPPVLSGKTAGGRPVARKPGA